MRVVTPVARQKIIDLWNAADDTELRHVVVAELKFHGIQAGKTPFKIMKMSKYAGFLLRDCKDSGNSAEEFILRLESEVLNKDAS